MRSAEEEGYIKLHHVSTVDQSVNQLTKAQGAMAHCSSVALLMGQSAVADSMKEEAQQRFQHRHSTLPEISNGGKELKEKHGEDEVQKQAYTALLGTGFFEMDEPSAEEEAMANMHELEDLADVQLRKRMMAHIRDHPKDTEQIPHWFVHSDADRRMLLEAQQAAREDLRIRRTSPQCPAWSDHPSARMSTTLEKAERRNVGTTIFKYSFTTGNDEQQETQYDAQPPDQQNSTLCSAVNVRSLHGDQQPNEKARSVKVSWAPIKKMHRGRGSKSRCAYRTRLRHDSLNKWDTNSVKEA
jgi:hypothetical protein